MKFFPTSLFQSPTELANKISMKKIIMWIAVIALLVLDWLALDDITTGSEPDFYLEYAILIASFLFFAFVCYKNFYKKQKV